MLPLESKAVISRPLGAQLLKVVGLSDFPSATLPFERMALDLRDTPAGLIGSQLLDLPWGGIVQSPEAPRLGERPYLTILGDQRVAKSGDVIEVDGLRQRVASRYRRGDNGNVLFATERCNSYCVMCSQPPRQVQDDWRVSQLLDLIDLIDSDEPSLAISGGEPTLLGDGLVDVVERCASVLPATHVHILSNGRLLDGSALHSRFEGIHPNLSWGIPLYGDHYGLHDYVVQSEGAFAETLRGLYALEAAKQRVEIRVVLVRPTFERLPQIARFIQRNLPFVEHVALMGIEPIGFAKAHQADIWADPADFGDQLAAAINLFDLSGIGVSLYNLPLCVIDRSLWPYAAQSISTWKNDYLPACTSCSMKPKCGGFFSWVTPAWTSRAVAPIKETETCPAH
ncbi:MULTISPECIES: His-Xaa-Ser system radical SAM maturase HxsC [Stenotrophomonas]|uniref:His-Xaa-Ser system radical SAM maturase HxsC n=1 Tax=Stenotrophomonas TaxID=40323 RepID=UPI0008732868|nr:MULTISPECIES: His-Xaa-Ser system radical SAM maturase HxsC [Stenotrophomonas]OEZ02413.1 His-Xaa-Ser system radical SAM maturase HxsC [Stenotrophomonas sp. BIIR7]